MKTYRGYEIGTGWLGGIGVFCDGYQNHACETEAQAMAAIDGWIASWKVMVAEGHADVASAREALEFCGETI